MGRGASTTAGYAISGWPPTMFGSAVTELSLDHRVPRT